MQRYITIAKHSVDTGYSEDAIRNKIQRGVWREGEVWVKAPDGRVLIRVEGYNEWVEQQAACAPLPNQLSRSTSTTATSVAGRR